MSEYEGSWEDHGYHDYDPRYFYEDEDSDAESNRPVGADDWAQGDFDGGP